VKVLRSFIREVLDGFSLPGAMRSEVPWNLRFDVATTGRTGGNVLKDEAEEDDEERQEREALKDGGDTMPFTENRLRRNRRRAS
jgi:hypothetical protein